MKFTIYLLLSILLSSALYSQNDSTLSEKSCNSSLSLGDSQFFSNPNSEYLLDSIYYYGGQYLVYPDWSSLGKDIIVKRTSNGLPPLWLHNFINLNDQTVDTFFLMEYHYPNIHDSIHFTRIENFKHSGSWGNPMKYTFDTEDNYELELKEIFTNNTWVKLEKKLYKNTSNECIDIDLEEP